jgi:hypothetical protein
MSESVAASQGKSNTEATQITEKREQVWQDPVVGLMRPRPDDFDSRYGGQMVWNSGFFLSASLFPLLARC